MSHDVFKLCCGTEDEFRGCLILKDVDQLRDTSGRNLVHALADAGLASRITAVAVAWGREKTIRVLNESDRYGNTPLHLAARQGHTAAVRILVLEGAKRDVKNLQKRTPLEIAVRERRIADAEKRGEREQCCEFLRGADLVRREPPPVAMRAVEIPIGMDLHGACESKGTSLRTFQQLLTEASLDGLRRTYNDGSTLLHILARRRDGVAFLGEFIKFWRTMVGVLDLNVQNREGNTPLHEAALCGHKDVEKFLLEMGALPSKVNRAGKTASDMTLDRKNRQSLELCCGTDETFKGCLESGRVGPKTKNLEGSNLFHILAGGGFSERMQMTMGKWGGDTSISLLEEANQHGDTPLHVAARCGHPEVVQFLLDKEINRSLTNKEGFTPLDCTLHQARIQTQTEKQTEYRECIRLLGSAWTAPSIFEGALTQLLEMDLGKACEVASLDEFKRLLTHATLEDLRKTYVEESTLFHIAARRPDGVGFLEELISAWRKIPGASIDLNVKNRLGNTPLHDAAFHGHESVTTYLLERGASASIVNRENKTPMDVARDRRNGRCLGAFGGNPGDVTVRLRPVNSQPGRQGILASEALAISCRVDSLENFIRALKSSAPAGLKWKGDESGDTLLHLAARRPEGVLFLQAIISARGQESFNVNAQNRLGRTPLHEASLSGHEDIVRLLLQKGALDSVPDLQGQTPIDVAKEPLKAYFIEYKRSIASPSKSAAVVFEESVAGPSAAPLAIPPLPIEPPRAPPSRATRSLFGGNRAIPPTTERRVIADFQAALIDRVRATPSGAHVGASAQAGERIAAKLEQRGASKK